MSNKRKPRLIYCQGCGTSQVVDGIVLPCITCGGGVYLTTKPSLPNVWEKRLTAYDRKWLKSMRISAE